MGKTPEGLVKDAVKAVLCRHKVYGYWPVPGGFGAATLDFLGCINGWFFAIETKAPGQKPTARQRDTISAMTSAGAVVFVIDGQPSQLLRLEKFLSYAALRAPIEATDAIPDGTGV